MEIESDNGDKFHLKPDAPISLGRNHVNDRTVSRRHISLKILHSSNQKSDEQSTRVSLEAEGKNPVWVRNGKTGEIGVYKKGQRAELGSGDAFSIYGKKHVWFKLRSEEDEVGGKVEDEVLGDVSDLEYEVVDVSQIDPVKEFGFVIMGHEFDRYSKSVIHDIKKWKWFLEEPKKGSEDDDGGGDAAGHRTNGRRRKRKKGKHDGHGDDDDEWEGESEEDKNLISNAKKIPKPTYSTRSKGGKSTKFVTIGKGKSKAQETRNSSKEEIGNGVGDDDETLGGFIVDNEEDIDDEIGSADEEDDEDEFEDDDDEDLA